MLPKLYNYLKIRVDTLHHIIGYKKHKDLLGRRNFSLAAKIFFWEMLLSWVKFLILTIKNPAASFQILKQSQTANVACDYSYLEHKLYQKKVRLFSLTGLSTIIFTTLILSLFFSFVIPEASRSYAKTNSYSQSDWSGGEDTVNFPKDPDNLTTPWIKYYSKDPDTTADATSIRSSVAGFSLTETSSADFDAGSLSGMAQSPAASADLRLVLPE
jgi:hypothetical protein